MFHQKFKNATDTRPLYTLIYSIRHVHKLDQICSTIPTVLKYDHAVNISRIVLLDLTLSFPNSGVQQ